ncbi:MAG: glycosyltransferase family 4 protein [Planctomycetales bacterium]|nr:glycosyltransferase family 4 protein [Planctomycetales bacterium]
MSAPARNKESARRLLLIAYRFDPDFSMESRLAWQRALTAAQRYHVTVLCSLVGPELQEARQAGVEVLHVAPSRIERVFGRGPGGFALAYARWRRRAFRAARARHQQTPFDLIHHVSYCGYRQPSLCHRLGVPYLWGPIGGTHAFPPRYLRAIDSPGAARELLRNIVNAFQLHWSPAVRAAMNDSTTVLAASQQARQELAAAGHDVEGVMLETGVATVDEAPRPPRDPGLPLRILWAGRACSWKALPLLLRALAGVAPDCHYQLRVMSAGPQLKRWQREATKLGLGDCVQWVGWPGCAAREPHYRWADVFAFTSLRDTSGTGLLEALAVGVPVIGVDHQGAADVLTDRCSLKVPATNPAATITGFRDGVQRLAADPELLAQLAQGAVDRARDYLWSRQSERLWDLYETALAGAPSPTTSQPNQPAEQLTTCTSSSPLAAVSGCTRAEP